MDQAIITGLKNKDLQSFELLFDSLYSQVRLYAKRITNDPLEAQDIAQQSFLKFWESEANDFENMIHVKSYIFTAARNLSINYLKRQKLRQKHSKETSYLLSAEEDHIIDRSSYEAPMFAAIYKLIEDLPPRTKEVFKMVYIQDLKREEVALLLDISVNTVHRLCSEAKSKLRKFSATDLALFLFVIKMCHQHSEKIF